MTTPSMLLRRGPRKPEDGPTEQRKKKVLIVGLLLIFLGIGSLVAALAWDPRAHIPHVAHEFLVALWPFCLTIALAVLVYEFWLRESFIAELISVSGPRVIQALRPRETLRILLDLVYGKRGQNRDVVAGVLGGYGEASDHRDLSINESTAVTLTLADSPGDLARYDLTIAAEYRFDYRTPVDDLYIFFVTSDPTIRNILTVASSRAPVDFWYFPNAKEFKNKLAKLEKTIVVSVVYEDAEGVEGETAFFEPDLERVETEKWSNYLRIFREDIGASRQLDPDQYKDSLAVLTFRFGDQLNEQPTNWRTIRGINIKSTTEQDKTDGYCYWAAVFPSLVTELSFDVSDLSGVRGEKLEFCKIPFLLRAHSVAGGWTREPKSLKPGTWLLGGHGVSLLWRSAEPQDTSTGTDRDGAIPAARRPGRPISIGEAVDVSAPELWSRIIRRAASGTFGDSSEIILRRRDAERLTGSLSTGSRALPSEDLTLDSPWWRLAMVSARKGDEAGLFSEVDHALDSGLVGSPAMPTGRELPWLWNETEVPPAINRAFADAVEQTFDQGSDVGWAGGPVSLDGSAQSARLREITELGWQELSGHVPELLDAVRDHVGCIAWLALESSDTTFKSGSTPELPGMVLLSTHEVGEPGYFPEAFVHEAAHCKFYDLCASRNIVGNLREGDRLWTTEIPWVTETSRRATQWPVDQVLAAAHAYLHVALLAGGLVAAAADTVAESHWQAVWAMSNERAEFLLAKLDEVHINMLGSDGRAFVEWLQGLAQLIRGVLRYVGSGWSGTGPHIRLRFPVKTLRSESSDYGLIGVSDTNEMMWVPLDALTVLETTHPMTIGDLAREKIAADASAPVDALIDAIELVGELEAMGIVEVETG